SVLHPATSRRLPTIGARRSNLLAQGLTSTEMPSPENAGAGCRFASRCPAVMPICREQTPPLRPVDGGGVAACHLHDHGPRLAGRPVGTWLAGIANKDPRQERMHA